MRGRRPGFKWQFLLFFHFVTWGSHFPSGDLGNLADYNVPHSPSQTHVQLQLQMWPYLEIVCAGETAQWAKHLPHKHEVPVVWPMQQTGRRPSVKHSCMWRLQCVLGCNCSYLHTCSDTQTDRPTLLHTRSWKRQGRVLVWDLGRNMTLQMHWF